MAPKASPVPDDWENDESDDEEPEEERNRRIWEEANTKSAAPMPTIVSSSAPMVNPLPPPAALQPTLRILKRPSPSSSAQSTPGTSTPDIPANLKEREARYQAARERIFGVDDSTQTPAASPSPSVNSPQPTARLVREPRGPDDSQGGGAKGFASRRGGNKTGS